MAANAKKARPLRTLIVLFVLVVALFGAIGVGLAKGETTFLPKFALDLEGGTQLVLTPIAAEGNQEVTTAQIDEAINIIRSRVDSSGVAEPEIARQGNRNIVVSIPGNPTQDDIDLVTKSAKMTFRTVLYVTGATPVTEQSWMSRTYPNPDYVAPPTANPDEPLQGEETGEENPEGGETPEGEEGADAPEGDQPDASAEPSAEASASASPSATRTSTPAPSSDVNASTGNLPVPPDEAYTTRLDDGLNEAYVYPQVIEEYGYLLEGQDYLVESKVSQGLSEDAAKAQVIVESINCQMVGADRGNEPSDPDKPLVTCDDAGEAAYILGPVMVQGSVLKSAQNAMQTTQQGNATGQWVVNIEFNSAGGRQFGAVTERLDSACKANAQDPRRQFAIVLDDVTISAPQVCTGAINDGRAEISGSFTQQSSKTLAGQLSFGSLPINFNVDSQDQISATAGSEQLTIGLWAGLIGLILVGVYSFFQYRALSVVTMLSLILATGISYGTIVLLGWLQGYRLSLAGVAGMIVAIGITADSFIVYFERIRDELRVGRPLPQAVDLAWLRARRTIWASDAVNFIAAVVLYMVAVGGVRGFAFTLGLTTIMDLVVVMLFTHPMILLLTKLPFWADGHPWSGLDPWRLGAPGSVHYAGRGRISVAPARSSAKPAGSKAKTEKGTAGAASATAVAVAERVQGDRGLSIAERKRLAAEKATEAADERIGEDDEEGGESDG